MGEGCDGFDLYVCLNDNTYTYLYSSIFQLRLGLTHETFCLGKYIHIYIYKYLKCIFKLKKLKILYYTPIYIYKQITGHNSCYLHVEFEAIFLFKILLKTYFPAASLFIIKCNVRLTTVHLNPLSD